MTDEPRVPRKRPSQQATKKHPQVVLPGEPATSREPRRRPSQQTTKKHPAVQLPEEGTAPQRPSRAPAIREIVEPRRKDPRRED